MIWTLAVSQVVADVVPVLCVNKAVGFAPTESITWFDVREPWGFLPCHLPEKRGFNWWFSIFFDADGLSIDVFYPQAPTIGQKIAVPVGKRRVSWIHGRPELVKKKLDWATFQAFLTLYRSEIKSAIQHLEAS